jgi:hypothetical protein
MKVTPEFNGLAWPCVLVNLVAITNTVDWAIYKQQKFISHCLETGKSRMKGFRFVA